MTYTRFCVKGNNGQAKKPSYIKGANNLKCERTIINTKYPEPVKIYEDAPDASDFTNREEQALEFIFSPEEADVYAPPKRTNVSSRLMSGFALVFLALVSVLSVYVLELEAPDYIYTAFMSSYEYLSDKYSQLIYSDEGLVYASGTVTETTPSASQDIEYENDFASPEYESSEGSFIANAVLSQSNDTGNSESSASPAGSYSDLQEIEATEGTAQIVSRNLSRGSDKVYALNETSLELDTEALATADYPIPAYNGEDGPLVLIVHTHGTECFADSTPSGDVRCTDTEKNIVRVGEELSDILNSYGIPTLHSKTMHDEISFISAYQSSNKEVKQLLSEYPSIKYVIDVHRDAIPNDGQARVKSYAEINGEPTAQIMFVMGTNGGGGNHPLYKTNLTVASHIQRRVNELYPGLARPINLRNAIFNQNLSTGYMLLEVGSDANTLSEALSAVRMFARGFAQTIIKGE